MIYQFGRLDTFNRLGDIWDDPLAGQHGGCSRQRSAINVVNTVRGLTTQNNIRRLDGLDGLGTRGCITRNNLRARLSRGDINKSMGLVVGRRNSARAAGWQATWTNGWLRRQETTNINDTEEERMREHSKEKKMQSIATRFFNKRLTNVSDSILSTDSGISGTTRRVRSATPRNQRRQYRSGSPHSTE